MRRKIVAGNWKMNNTLEEGVKLAKGVDQSVIENDVLVILGTPYIHLAEVTKVINRKNLFVSAQNCASDASGAFTGEISASMIKSTGAKFVILGHSERRAYYHETNEILKRKTDIALENDLEVVFCCGEVLSERENGIQNEVVTNQLKESLFHLTSDQFKKIIIAYEPVWAIGTGKTATSDQAQEMHKVIRDFLSSKYGSQVSDQTSILYGGSCKPSNAGELFANPDVDGGLIGGASLNVPDFMGIVNAF